MLHKDMLIENAKEYIKFLKGNEYLAKSHWLEDATRWCSEEHLAMLLADFALSQILKGASNG